MPALRRGRPDQPARFGWAFSSVGVFRTEDGGESWQLCNRGLPNIAPGFIKDPDMGRCVHKLVPTPCGRAGWRCLSIRRRVWVSADAADSWTRISTGIPHEFGFDRWPRPRAAICSWCPCWRTPIAWCPTARWKVWRNRGRGRAWRAFRKGLPQKEHFVGVLRDAMAADTLTPGGVYLGNDVGGELFYSRKRRRGVDPPAWVIPGSRR